MDPRPRSVFRAAIDLRSIRGKLLLVVGMLLLLGGVNVVVSYWGSRPRDIAFSQLLRAIEAQRQRRLHELRAVHRVDVPETQAAGSPGNAARPRRYVLPVVLTPAPSATFR